jgi:hypothetical protein
MENVEYLEKFGVRVLHVNPRNRVTQEFICESQNLIRDVVLDEGYDYLFSLESDVFPQQKDIIERLMVHDLPIVSAPYFIDIGEASHLLIGVLVKSFVAKHGLFGIILPKRYGFFLMDGKLKPTNQCGIGCSLIKREIIESTPFRYEKGMLQHSDSFFYLDLFRQGVPTYIDTAVFARHENSNWNLIHNTWR